MGDLSCLWQRQRYTLFMVSCMILEVERGMLMGSCEHHQGELEASTSVMLQELYLYRLYFKG